ncbi:MAG: TadE/TadG family type IV pilus assembly protein [Acidimicrobiales bacterium]
MSHRALSPRSRPLPRFLRRDEHGAAAVEFAIIAIPFFLLLYGLVVFGMALAVKQSVTNAAAEGARAAVGITDAADAVDKAEEVVASRLDWLGSNYQSSDLTVSWYNTTTSSCGAATPPSGQPWTICVAIDLPYKSREVVPAAPIVSNVTPEHLRSTAIVQVGS